MRIEQLQDKIVVDGEHNLTFLRLEMNGCEISDRPRAEEPVHMAGHGTNCGIRWGVSNPPPPPAPRKSIQRESDGSDARVGQQEARELSKREYRGARLIA